MYEQSHRDYPALVICIIVWLAALLTAYFDESLLSRRSHMTKNARELKLANAAITDMINSVMLLRSMQNTRRS